MKPGNKTLKKSSKKENEWKRIMDYLRIRGRKWGQPKPKRWTRLRDSVGRRSFWRSDRLRERRLHSRTGTGHTRWPDQYRWPTANPQSPRPAANRQIIRTISLTFGTHRVVPWYGKMGQTRIMLSCRHFLKNKFILYKIILKNYTEVLKLSLETPKMRPILQFWIF